MKVLKAFLRGMVGVCILLVVSPLTLFASVLALGGDYRLLTWFEDRILSRIEWEEDH